VDRIELMLVIGDCGNDADLMEDGRDAEGRSTEGVQRPKKGERREERLDLLEVLQTALRVS
jgi:hypothetical protein